MACSTKLELLVSKGNNDASTIPFCECSYLQTFVIHYLVTWTPSVLALFHLTFCRNRQNQRKRFQPSPSCLLITSYEMQRNWWHMLFAESWERQHSEPPNLTAPQNIIDQLFVDNKISKFLQIVTIIWSSFQCDLCQERFYRWFTLLFFPQLLATSILHFGMSLLVTIMTCWDIYVWSSFLSSL